MKENEGLAGFVMRVHAFFWKARAEHSAAEIVLISRRAQVAGSLAIGIQFSYD